ncbi:S1 family peptidase [Leptospira fletcheri]|nr:serine protease [Leptospira fletcheri]
MNKCFILFLTSYSLAYCNINQDSSFHSLVEGSIKNDIESRIVTIYKDSNQRPNGTGFILDQSGTILTALHVFFPGDKIQVAMEQENPSAATLKKSEPLFDLGLLSSALSAPTRALEYRERVDLSVGERVWTIASPYGLQSSYMEGIVSHLDRRGISNRFSNVPLIQIQGISYPGASGALVFDRKGRAIGMIMATFGFDSGNGIGLVLPGAYIQVFLKK